MSVSTAQVVSLLENVLFESATLAKANAGSWVQTSQTVSGDGTVVGLAQAMATSAEAGIVQQVVRYYEGALGRAPGGAEILYYVGLVENGLTASQIAQGASAVSQATWNNIAAGFANSPEFQTISGSASGVVNALYLNILGRTPAASEAAFYQNQLSQGYTNSLLVQEFTNSPEYQTAVSSDIRGGLVAYGSGVVGGTPTTTIPLNNTAHVTTATLGTSALTVTGGPVTQEIIVLGTPASAGQSAVTAVTGVIGVTAVTAATGVQGVTAVTAVTPVAGVTAVTAASDGAVTVNDAVFASGGTGTLTTVNLANSGAGSVINDNALQTFDLSGTAGTVTINNSTSGPVTLTMLVNGLSAANNTITDTNKEVTTLNVAAITADSTLSAFVDSNLTTLNVSGTKKLTLLAINSSLTTLAVTGGAGFSDGASVHGTGLAALGKALSITDGSTGSFSAVLDDTTQSFTSSGSGADIITVSALTDATKTITAGTSTANEIVFEGGAYALTSASKGKLVGFQTVGLAANVSGTIDLSVVDPTATGIEVMGANSIAITNAAANAGVTLDSSTGATVSVAYADSTGASDKVAVAMSSAVGSLSLQDAKGVGIGTVSITNNLGSGETNVSAAHTIGTFTDGGLSTLNLSGTAGLSVTALTGTGATFTLNNTSTNGNGLTVGALSDAALATLTLSGSGLTTIGQLTSAATSLSISNGAAAASYVGTLTDATLTTLTLSSGVALGQSTSALTTNGLQDAATAGVTVSGASDNAHVTVNLTNGAASGATDAITLGGGNNVVVDSSTAGTVTVTLGSGANLVELGGASLNTTASFTVTLAARTATPPNAIVIGTAGNNYASAPNLVVTGVTKGDIIAFGNDTASSSATLTATSLTSASSVATAVAALEAVATTAHQVVYGVYSGNTYIVETASGTLGKTDTTVVEVTGSQTLTATAGYVTIGGTASTYTGGGALSGASFTIPAGTATSIALGVGTNQVTLTGPSTGVSDTFTGTTATTGLTVNYQATSGTDTINLSGVSALAGLAVNDTSTGSAGVTIGAFTDNSLTSATYNNSAATGAVMTQSALTSSSLNTINLTGGVASQATNTYFISATLTTTSAVAVNDSNLGTGATTMGLTLNGGTSALTLNMTGPGTLATGALTDNNLAALNLTGGGAGSINVGALSDSLAGAFTVNDTSTSTGADVIVLTGLSAATSLIVNDSAASALTDSSAYTDAALATLTLKNTGAGALTIGGGGIQANALTNITFTGSGTGSITTGTVSDTGSAALTVTDSYASTGSITLPLSGVSAATGITITDSAAGALSVGAITDNAMTALSLTDTGAAALTVGAVTANAMTSLIIAGSGAVTVGAISDTLAGALTVTDSSTNTTAATLTIASLPNATAVTVADSAKGALTISAFTDSSAATLTFNNTGSALLTANGVTDSAAAVAMTIAGSGTGTEAITLIDAGATSLTITDTSTSTGAATVTPTLAGGPASLVVTDSASGGLTIAAFTDTNLTAATLTNSGAGTLTIGGITGGTALNSLLIEGSGTISASMTTTATTGNISIGSGDSGSATLTALNVGTGVLNNGNLVIASTTGNLTISGGTDYVTGIGLDNVGTGTLSLTATDLAVGATTVAFLGTGAETLNLTDIAATVTVTQVGNANVTLILNHNGVSGDILVLGGGNNSITLTDGTPTDSVGLAVGGGINAISLPTGHTAPNVLEFVGTLGSNSNVSPVAADTISHFLTDSGTVQGDTLQLGPTGSSVTTVITTADANTGGNALWTVSAGGMMTKAGASVLNFIADIQSITQAGGVATTSGVAGFSDGTNTWIAYNNHAGGVGVVELVGVVVSGIETGASLTAGYVHVI